MTTVKEFKYLGGVYVANDVMMGLALSDDGAEYLNASKGWDDDETTSFFAWRLNTGVMPKFTGKAEVTWQNDEVEVINTSDYHWAMDDSVYIVKWRPLLDQSKKSAYDVDAHVSGDKAKGGVIPNNILGQMCEVDKREAIAPNKPVFKQAMADKGELPPVGSECKFLWSNLTECSGSNQDRTLKVIAYNAEKTEVWGKMNGESESGIYIINTDIKLIPLDTRTPKQKAVDEMLSDSRCSGSVIEVSLERLYDKGYRKC
jgi:hypothetical protein